MRRGLGVVAVLVLVSGVGCLSAAAQLAGFANTQIDVNFTGPSPFTLAALLDLGVEYSVDDWTFGAELRLDDYGIEDLAFLTTGRLGPFNVYSLFGLWDVSSWFLWTDFDNAVWIDMLGVELWAFFSIETGLWFDPDSSGAGLALGGHGAIGVVEIWGEVSFNLEEIVPFIYWNGLEAVISENLACDLIEVMLPVCDLDFSFAQFYVDFPFCCVDAGAWVGFDESGFGGFEVWAEDIPIGETGLSLEFVLVSFEEDWKELDLEFGIDAGDAICIVPFISLVQASEFTMEEIALDALELTCTVGDVSITVSELLALGDYYIGIDGAIHMFEWDASGWTLPSECVEPLPDAEEAIAIEVGRDDCCGPSSFGLYSFFDIDLDDALFDWLGLRARAESSVSSSLSLFLEVWMWYDGIESMTFGVEITWGELKNLQSDSGPCCWGGLL